MKIDDQFDLKMCKQAQEFATQLKQQYAARNVMNRAMDDMYFVRDEDEGARRKLFENMKITKSPDAKAAIDGFTRLLGSTDPKISVPIDPDLMGSDTLSSKLEIMADTMLQAAGRIAGNPIHYDILRSAALYSEIHISIESTQDELLRLQGMDTRQGDYKAQIARAERAAALTPYLFNVTNPTDGYPEIDGLGLRHMYRETKMTVGALVDKWGKRAQLAVDAGKNKKLNRFDVITVGDLWDLENRQVWIQGIERPVWQDKHNLPFIPWVVSYVEGSRLFQKQEEQRMPFLYSLWKSELWKRQNLALTVFYTQLFALGTAPVLKHTLGPNGNIDSINFDYTRPVNVVHVPDGDDLVEMDNKIVRPEVMQGFELAERKIAEATIYKQALGEPLGGSAPFSSVALLSQAGRLPLVVAQKKSEWAIADMLLMAFEWMRHDKGQYKSKYMKKQADIKSSDIPEDLQIEVSLDVDLPQDKLSQSQIAMNLVERRLASMEWARREFLQIDQSDVMDEQIWSEQAAQALAQAQIQTMVQQAMMQVQQQQAMAQQAQHMAMQGPPRQQGAPPPGSGMMQGIPPVMAQNGGQGPMQPPGMPPEEAMV